MSKKKLSTNCVFQIDLDAHTRFLGAQSASARQRDLHDQVESHRTRHTQSQLEFDTGER